jgi:hypothetical protein
MILMLLIAFGGGLYTQRIEVLEWYRGVTMPTLPEAVEYKQVVEAVEVLEVVDTEPSVPSVEYDPAPPDLPVLEQPVVEAPATESVEDESPLPASMHLAVPFTSQAPHGNWDEPYQEACEEASVYMVHAYFSGVDEGQIPADTADEVLLKMVEFEMGLYGFYKDTTVEQTGIFAELMYGHAYQVLIDPSVEDIQRKLVQGHPVIVPAAGRLLGNPYFTAPGPMYHMLVIRGYTQDGQFIVNDPGTYRGEAYLYEFDTIMLAMHDWNDGNEITNGRKAVLVLSP